MSRRPSNNPRRRNRPPGIFRIGDRARPDVQADRTRLTLFLTNYHLDLAEHLSANEGFNSIQKYCEALLEEALEGEQSRSRLAETEANRGPLEGLREIADDPEYLAEWNATMAAASGSGSNSENDGVVIDVESRTASPFDRALDVPATQPNQAIQTVLAHVGGETETSFLAALRRGETPSSDGVADLVDALGTLDAELSGSKQIDRRLAYALHRLAFESQVLLTDAWPGAFDASTIHTLRAIQEAVDRILSGEDIRYLES